MDLVKKLANYDKCFRIMAALLIGVIVLLGCKFMLSGFFVCTTVGYTLYRICNWNNKGVTPRKAATIYLHYATDIVLPIMSVMIIDRIAALNHHLVFLEKLGVILDEVIFTALFMPWAL